MADKTPMEKREARVQHFLADVFRTRIIDITRDDVLTFQANLRRHGLMLVMDEAVIR